MSHPKTRKNTAPKTPEAEATPDPLASPSPDGRHGSGFFIVGIGASAGGLSAFEAFFSSMPPDVEPNMAFVIVQHLAPDHKSLLPELIRRYTRLQVYEVEDNMVIQPNCVYIIPPDCDMVVMNGSLQLLRPAASRLQRLAIDFFFRSLAQDQREHAVGIVLSGMGSDGAQGIRAIKSEGGMVMVQAPASTEYDGMPRSALDTGLVDYELLPAAMMPRLLAYVQHAAMRPDSEMSRLATKGELALKKICGLINTEVGHDFSQYKPSTLNRRIARRMAVHQIANLDEYVSFLNQTPVEVEALFRDLLIGVTSFFRDLQAFDALEVKGLPYAFSGKPAESVFRCWVPACSTGEEAYSLAILLSERQATLKQSLKIQIFATDIDARAIAAARRGFYPASIANDLSPERLAHFFEAEPNGAGYRIQKSLRDMIVFSEQDVIKDPPFSMLDMISCRNLLIYMGTPLQKKLLDTFLYALNPGGLLFLGSSETVGDYIDRFASLDRGARLYKSIKPALSARSQASTRFALPEILPVSAALRQGRKGAFPVKSRMRELAEQALMLQVAPAAILVDDTGEVCYLHGRTGMYLEPPPGDIGAMNILKMAREGLRLELTTALLKAKASQELVRCPGLRVKTNGHFATVNLTVRPLAEDPDPARTGAPSGSSLYLVILEEAPEAARAHSVEVSSEILPGESGQIVALKRELRAKEDHLQGVFEEMETSNEELKSSNEELQSLNEELQSTNEEFETSKEELQSANEELVTINSEQQTKVAELTRMNNDMVNLLAGTNIATLFLDTKLRVMRFTPAITEIINLLPVDEGRFLGHIRNNLDDYSRLVEDAQGVLDTLMPREIEVRSAAQKWYFVRIQPYRTINNVIEGVVIVFFDITSMKQAQGKQREAESVLRVAMDQSPVGIAIADAPSGMLRYMNPAGLGIRGVDAKYLLQEIDLTKYVSIGSLFDLAGVPLKPDEVPLARAVSHGEASSLEFIVRNAKGEDRIVMANASPVRDEQGKVFAGIAVFQDVSDDRRREQLKRKEEGLERLAVVVNDSNDAVTVQDLEGRILAWNPSAVRLYGWSEKEALAMNIRELITTDQRDEALAVMRRLCQSDTLEAYRLKRLTKDGRIVEVMVTASALINEAGRIYAISTTERVIHE
ncbi:MAG: chemotaxis protein CheB [bacterium]